MLVSQIESHKFFGKLVIGRINSGITNVGDKLGAFDQSGTFVEGGKIHKLLRRVGMNQVFFNKLNFF
jgi:GTP-binding protein